MNNIKHNTYELPLFVLKETLYEGPSMEHEDRTLQYLMRYTSMINASVNCEQLIKKVKNKLIKN